MADRINAARKFVATHRPDSLAWGLVGSLGAEIVDGVRTAKAQDGPNPIIWGSLTLTPLLLEHELADEIMLFVFPVLLARASVFSPMGRRRASSRSSKRRRRHRASLSAPTGRTARYVPDPSMTTTGKTAKARRSGSARVTASPPFSATRRRALGTAARARAAH